MLNSTEKMKSIERDKKSWTNTKLERPSPTLKNGSRKKEMNKKEITLIMTHGIEIGIRKEITKKTVRRIRDLNLTPKGMIMIKILSLNNINHNMIK